MIKAVLFVCVPIDFKTYDMYILAGCFFPPLNDGLILDRPLSPI